MMLTTGQIYDGCAKQLDASAKPRAIHPIGLRSCQWQPSIVPNLCNDAHNWSPRHRGPLAAECFTSSSVAPAKLRGCILQSDLPLFLR